mgnify:CR=1 FL=1
MGATGMTQPKTIILVVEDNDDDLFFLMRAFKSAGIEDRVFRVEDGGKAIAYLDGQGEFKERDKYPLPELVLLDLKLPIYSGHEVMAWIQSQPKFRDLPVFILTSSNEALDRNRSKQLGVTGYFVKPLSAEQLSGILDTR